MTTFEPRINHSAFKSPAPYFSICIPQYNRTDFLIEACAGYAGQSFTDFEVCISDDCSNDGKSEALEEYLSASGLRYILARNKTNLRYDGNLRTAIGLSSGRYLLLMGNDDKLATPTTLAELKGDLDAHGDVAAAIANYRELSTGTTFRRMKITEILGSGPETAVKVFRSYSFISGVILDGSAARAEATGALDGSEMYQMYLGTRLVGRGGRFLAIDRLAIDKDIQIPGQDVDSYRTNPRVSPCPIIKRRLPMGRLLEVVAFGLRPCVTPTELNRLLARVARDLYTFTYAYWGIEFRRVQSWRYALGVLLALEPREIAGKEGLPLVWFVALWPVYLTTSAIALIMPTSLFDRLRPYLYRIAKRS